MRKLLLTLWVSLGFVLVSYAQKTISGKVTDANGAPLSNVSVIVKGSNAGTTTDAAGTFSLTVPANAKQIVFSILGYETQSISAGSNSFNVRLTSSGATDLTNVVVTGLSKVKKSQYTGASSRIDEKQLKNQPVGSFDQILQGRAPGLIALTGSGAPGTSANVIIRGQGSLSAGNDPLYVVDGIPVEAGVFQGLDPNNFATVDVLRDAASTALYGSRGSAGVIVITTKRGIAGKMKLGYSVQMGVKSKPDFAFRPMTTAELLTAQKNYGAVSGDNTNAAIPGWFYSADNPRYAALTAAEKAQADLALDSISRINTNWYDQIFRSANFSNHQLSLSGGTGKTRIYSALGMYNEEGITLRTDMKRITLATNVDYADDKFTLAISSNIGYTKRNFQQSTGTNSLGNPFLSSVVNVPYAKLYNDNGGFATGVGSSFAAANQLDLTKYDKNFSNQIKTTLGLTTSYKVTSHITLGLTTGVDFRETQNTNYGSKIPFVRASSSSITGKAGFQTEGLSRFLTASVRPSATYRNMFLEKHDVEFTVLGEYVTELEKVFSATGFGTDPKRPNTPAAITQGNTANQLFARVTGGKSSNALSSGLVTARYTYNGKYTFSGSFRRDGSSKLPVDTRWQSFYSVGGVWDASKEDFIKSIRAINSLRIKLSYGSSGNANNFPVGDFGYLAQNSTGNYNGTNTIFYATPGNDKLKWEKTYVTNLGVDFEIINRRIYGDVNVYSKITKDLFVLKSLPASTGFGQVGQDINVGQLSNKGVEVSLTGEVISTKNLVWSLYGNVAYNKNRIDDLGGLNEYENPNGTDLFKVGLPVGSHYEVEWAGVDAATGQPLYYTKDNRITNTYSDADRVTKYGTWEAPWKGGFGTSLRFKGFDLNTLFSWQSGSKKVDNMEYFVENPVGFLASGYNQSADLNFWQKPGDLASTPSPLYGTSFSSKIIHDASFLRLREVTLSYSLPKSMVSKTKIVSNARFFVQGNNLFIWTKWRGLDPEAGATNINLSEFPNPRTFTAGLELNF